MAIITISGNTSGSISLSAPDISGSNTLTLPVATDTLIGKATTDTLTNKSIAASQLTGTIAAAALPAGSVIQVVNATYSTSASNSTNTWIDTGLTATITPSSASNKILVFVSQVGCSKQTGDTYLGLRLLRGASTIVDFEAVGGYNATATQNNFGSCSTAYLDSPATTSATTYKTQFKSDSNIALVVVQRANMTSTITLMEIAG
jgi:hypothetical protein